MWPDSLHNLQAVETSASMKWVGSRIEKRALSQASQLLDVHAFAGTPSASDDVSDQEKLDQGYFSQSLHSQSCMSEAHTGQPD